MRCDRVEQLGGGWHAEFDYFTQEAAGNVQALRDVAGAIEVWVHDQALPSYGGAWLFEVDAHHEQHAVFDFLCEDGEFLCVFTAGFKVVDRARADHYQLAAVVAENDFMNRFAALRYEFAGSLRFLDLLAQCDGRWEERFRRNVDVGDFFHDVAGVMELA